MPDPEPLALEDVSSLYLSHHGWLRGWLRRRLGCPSEAADLAVERVAAPNQDVAAWIDGQLVVDDDALGEVVAEMARCWPGRLAYDSRMARLRMSDAFPLDDTDRALARSLPVRIVFVTPYWATVGRRDE